MASAEGKAPYNANCFTPDFRMPLNSPDHPSSVSKKLVSDWVPIRDQIHANSVCVPRNLNSDRVPEMKWWLHVKSDLGDEASYMCQHLNTFESELDDAFYAEFLNGNVKSGGEKLVKDVDAFSNVESPKVQPWHVSPTCLKNNNTRMPKIEASLNTDLHFTCKKKDQEEFCFLDSHFMDCDISSFLVSEQGKMPSSDLELHLMGAEKSDPWWRTAGRDELASSVAQKSLEHIENCDLPQPLTKHVRQKPPYTKGFNHDKTPPSSLNHKTETGSSNADGYTTGISTSDYSFQDSNKHSSSSQSTDSSSSNKSCQINSENSSSMSELLKALCHSQTRAREAEKAAQQAFSEKEHILSLFFRQASQLFAYKQWLHMLQLENLCLQLRNKNQSLINLFPASLPWAPYRGMLLKKSHRSGKRKNSNRRCGITKCVVAFAVGLGLAGAGLLLGWTMGWMFPPL
ncbi:hypothetical protein Fmac_007541 [Flemingia macrophylla]|uniref:Uncharacterized protein n=1 Tax=Flemingia macrophylla TaxID=520843 RepID=A0ABD1MVC2_9FABA